MKSQDEKEYLVGECKLKKEAFNFAEYLNTKTKLSPLQEKARLYYALFSESGFDDKVMAEAEKDINIHLYTLDQIVNYM